jgi:hypothetical protein
MPAREDLFNLLPTVGLPPTALAQAGSLASKFPVRVWVCRMENAGIGEFIARWESPRYFLITNFART